jgi:hypothetical protein
MKNDIIYAARDTSTGELVNNITNPRRRYWDKRGNAINAINAYNSRTKRKHGTLELVAFKLVEVEE